MFRRDRQGLGVVVPFGERTTFQYHSDDGSPLRIIDFTYISITQFTEGTTVQKDLMLALLEDQSLVVSSSLTGRQLLRFKLDEGMLGEDDRIVDIQPSPSSMEQFFVLLSEQGRLIVVHYDIVDTRAGIQKYAKHLA